MSCFVTVYLTCYKRSFVFHVHLSSSWGVDPFNTVKNLTYPYRFASYIFPLVVAALITVMDGWMELINLNLQDGTCKWNLLTLSSQFLQLLIDPAIILLSIYNFFCVCFFIRCSLQSLLFQFSVLLPHIYILLFVF